MITYKPEIRVEGYLVEEVLYEIVKTVGDRFRVAYTDVDGKSRYTFIKLCNSLEEAEIILTLILSSLGKPFLRLV
jgi:hypothetical protein